ncbi:MAG: VanZ family protein [Chloroflexi bacterium]|nr:VanZ family protein [Chloroflexota bacterium]
MKWIATLFGLFIVLIIVLADAGRLGFLGFLNQIPFGDKAGHFILYGILTLFIDLALLGSFPRQDRNLVVVRCGLVLALLIGLEEFSQQIFAKRSFDLIDLAFSYLGVIFFSWLTLKIKKGRS